jgi:heme exporter protein D
MSEFFDMGGYAAFVWPAYLAVTLVIVILGVQSWRRQKALTGEAARLKQEMADQAASADEETA